MNKKLTQSIILVLLVIVVLCGCDKTYTVNTPVGEFEMQSNVVESFGEYLPSAGSEFLLIYMKPTGTDVSIDTMSEYFRPGENKKGPIAAISGTEHNLKYLAYSSDIPPVCVLIYEIASGTKNVEQISLRLP